MNSTAANYGRVIYPHYVWVIVTVIAVMQMVGTSIRMAFGVFIEPLEQTFDWSQGSITLAYAISSVVTALASPFAGWFGDRFGARRAMTIGTAMFLAGMLLTGYISTIWELYLYFGVLLGVAQAIFLVPLIPAAMHWFRRHLGMGMGIIMASWGLGPALAAMVVSLLLEGMGWQNGFIALGIGSAAIMFVLIGLFRDTPADKGIQPYGYRPGDVMAQKRKVDPAPDEAVQRVHAEDGGVLEYVVHPLSRLCGACDHIGVYRAAGGEGRADAGSGGGCADGSIGGERDFAHIRADTVRHSRDADGDVRVLRGAGRSGGDAVLDA